VRSAKRAQPGCRSVRSAETLKSGDQATGGSIGHRPDRRRWV